MSATIAEQRGTAPGIGALPIGQQTINLDLEKSKVRYLWWPHVNIPLWGAEGLKMRLGRDWEYYGMGRPGENDGQIRTAEHPGGKTAETQVDYEARSGHILTRCTAWPIWNIYYYETKYNRGEFTEEEKKTGNPKDKEIPLVQRLEYSGICGADFTTRYEEYGARVLLPFIGMEPDDGLVSELFTLVQPYAHKLTNLKQELANNLTDEETLLFDLAENGPAHHRILGAKLNPQHATMAHNLRRIMLGGVRSALKTAKHDWFDLMQQLSNTQKGQTGNKKGPDQYHVELAQLLGEPIPAVVASVPQGDPNVGKAVDLLTQIVTSGGIPQPAIAPPGTFMVTPEQLADIVNKAVDERLGTNGAAKKVSTGKEKEGSTK